jgi:hypothetical protein
VVSTISQYSICSILSRCLRDDEYDIDYSTDSQVLLSRFTSQMLHLPALASAHAERVSCIVLRQSVLSVDNLGANLNLSGQYTILTCSHLLDGDFSLLWHNLLPYESLKIHSAGYIVRLPRNVVVHYNQPYFEARVKTPMVVSQT